MGRRELNEDNFYPNIAIDHEPINNLFMVCDGVGGIANGEVASNAVIEGLVSYFQHNHKEINNSFISKAIISAEINLDKVISKMPDTKGMSTTLAMVYIENNNILITHIGDSRVYIIRNNEVVFQTKDHSLVNEWVDSGFITAAEALEHPKKHIITRAISGTEDPAKPEIIEWNQLENDDYILLCTDGILEGINDEFIGINFYKENKIENIAELIENECEEKSNDNYTCIIIKIENIAFVDV
jgi:PPM family protein phosphatase